MNNYLFELICARRGKRLRNVESVAFNIRCAFGLATLTELLPAVANTFYYISTLYSSVVVTQVTAPVQLRISPNSGQGSIGVIDMRTILDGPIVMFHGVETDSLLYIVSTNTAGIVCFTGEVYKITMTL